MISYEKKYKTLKNGETIAYIDKGSGDETIVLIHGNMASSVHMVTLIDELKGKHRVIAPDLRGFGDSSFNNDFLSLKELAYDLLLLLDELKIEKVHLVGWSTGFGVALELKILNTNLVKSIFSIQGMTVKGYYSLKTDKNGNVLSKRLYKNFEEMKKDDEQMLVHHEILKQNYNFIKTVWEKTLLRDEPIDDELLHLYVLETLKQRCQANINWCWVNFNISHEENLFTKGSGEIDLIDCPIYLTYGKEDNVVTKEMLDINLRTFKNLKVFEFENGDHTLQFKHLNKVKLIIEQMVLDSSL